MKQSHSTINPSTLSFLADLRANNNRDWFAENRVRYEAALANASDLAQSVLDLLRSHDAIKTSSGKRALYRLYRDNRFHPNRDPYKSWFGAHFRRATRSRRGGYYLHIEPDNSFAGGGFYRPESADLALIRSQIAADAEPLRKALANPHFVEAFGGLQGDQLKTAPRGYPRDHPAVDLLRYKSMVAMRPFSNEEVLTSDFPNRVDETLRALRPFLDVMSTYLTTDLNGTVTAQRSSDG